MEVTIQEASSRTQFHTELKVPPPKPSTQFISAQPSSQAINLQSGFVLAIYQSLQLWVHVPQRSAKKFR